MTKKLTIAEIDKKIWDIENYYPKGNKATSVDMLSWNLKDRMQLGRLYKLKDKRLSEDMMTKKNIISWSIKVEYENGTTEEIADVPNFVSNPVDEWITELENEN